MPEITMQPDAEANQQQKEAGEAYCARTHTHRGPVSQSVHMCKCQKKHDDSRD